MVGRKVKEQPHLFRLVRESWELWQRKQESWIFRNTGSLEELSQREATSLADAYLALPARYVIAAPLWLPKTDPAITRKMAEVELEIRGLISKTGDAVSIHIAHITESQMLVCAKIFPEPFPNLFCNSIFGYCNASPLFAALEANTLHVWQEDSDIVAVFTNGKEPIYWETIPFPASSTELLTWMDCIYLPLREQDFLPSELKFISYLDLELPRPHFCTIAISTQLPTPSLCEKPPPCDWKPPLHRAVKKASEKRKTYVLAGSIIVGLYLLAITAFSTWVGFRHFEANRMRQKIQALEPAIRNIMEIQKQWDSLGPTTESSGFPIEILHFVVKQMPAEKIWLTQFEFDHQKVAISGEAESVSIAAQFFTDISKALFTFHWDMPPPTLLSNNRAKFIISGKP